jgi:hypothetical protein
MAEDDDFDMDNNHTVAQPSDEIKCACLAQIAARSYRHIQHVNLTDHEGGYAKWIIDAAESLIQYAMGIVALHKEIIQPKPLGASVDGYPNLVLSTDPLRANQVDWRLLGVDACLHARTPVDRTWRPDAQRRFTASCPLPTDQCLPRLRVIWRLHAVKRQAKGGQ